MGVHYLLSSRQDCDISDPNCDGYDWYYSETAYIIRWAVIGTLIVVVFAFLIGSYMHAQRRMKRGLLPLRYHAWLVPRRQREQFYPRHGPAAYYHNAPYGYQQAMPLNTYGGPAPPAYGEHDYVPPYQPPEGSSKINPNQTYQNVYEGAGSSFNPPPGPPPRPAQLNRAASSLR